MTEAAGARLSKLLPQKMTFGDGRSWARRRDAQGRVRACASLDATSVRQQGEHGARADGRMAYVGMLYNPRSEHANSKRSTPVSAARRCRKVIASTRHTFAITSSGSIIHRYRANGWQIGSGPVESACKTVVANRLKGGGMRLVQRWRRRPLPPASAPPQPTRPVGSLLEKLSKLTTNVTLTRMSGQGAIPCQPAVLFFP